MPSSSVPTPFGREAPTAPRLFFRLAPALLLALALFLVAGLGLFRNLPESRAQGGIQVDKQLGRSSSVVRVGELLTFTIYITNTSGFTLTSVPMTDTYRADALGYAFSQPVEPDEQAIIGASGLLTWNNIAAPGIFGPIADGQVVSFTIGFTAEHPATAIVNAAGVHDAQDESGSHSFDGNSQEENDAVGGAAPVEKRIEPPGFTPEIGLPLTFSIVITNDGAAVMTELGLVDRYDPTALIFYYAIPTPTLVLTDTGVISWLDLTDYFGDIPADTAVTVTTVFTALPGIGLIETSNRAEVAGALDVYSNVLAPGSDQVPITIIGAPTPTPTSSHGDEDEDEDGGATPTPTPTSPSTPTPVAGPLITPTPTYTSPTYLPETGRPGMPGPALSIMIGIGLILAALISWAWRSVESE
jgi:hypothetical protein